MTEYSDGFRARTVERMTGPINAKESDPARAVVGATLGSVQCARHGLATGPDGRCALCLRRERALERVMSRASDPARKVVILVVSIMAAVATFFLVGALLDTR
jgi:hypothetical protein